MSDLVFWQEPDDNYVRVGNAVDGDDELRTTDVKRWGSTEVVPDELLRKVVV